MVQRTSQETQFQGGRGVAVTSGGTSMANPDYNEYKVSRNRDALQASESSADRLLNMITDAGQKLLEKSMEISQEEAYLKGAAAAGTGISEDELSSNPFTRDWAKAGMRDTLGRVAIAENEARIIEDMPKMREASPDEYNQYLAERRGELMPKLSGMSRRQRAATMQNLLMNDRAAIKKHTSEHMKYQIETETRSVQAANRVKVSAMGAAKDSAPAYATATQAAFSTLQSSILDNDKLPASLKASLISEYAEFALADDHQQLYELIQSAEVPLPGGGKGPVASMLSWDDSVKLSKVYRESRNRTEQYRSLQYLTDQARFQADWDNPDTPPMAETDALAFREQGIRSGFMSADQGKSFMQDYYKANAKKAKLGQGGAMWAAGDTGGLNSLDMTDDEGASAWMTKYGKNLEPQALATELIKIGVVQGRPAALRMLGKQLAPGLAQLGLNPELDPANSAILMQVMTTLDSAERTGRTGVYSTLLETLPQDQQAKLLDIREGVRSGLQFPVAVSQTMGKMAEYAKMAPQLRKAMGESNAKEDLEMLQSMDSVSLLDRIGLGVKSIFSTDAGNRLAISAKEGWRENPERVAEVSAQMKFAAADELRVLNMTHPFMSKDARQSTVLATLRGRTVDTSQGPLVIPRGTTLQSFFGVSASTSGQRVGAALDEFVKPQPGNRLVFSVQDGQLQYKELSSESRVVNSGLLNAKQVAPMIEQQRKREENLFKEVHGTGRTVHGITFNGANTGGLDMAQVFYMREALLSSGDIQIDLDSDSFKRITDKAATYSKLPMKTTGKYGNEALTLFSTLALVSNFKFTSQREYRPLLQALAGTDPGPALKALYETPVFKEADAKERAHLASQVNKILKGM